MRFYTKKYFGTGSPAPLSGILNAAGLPDSGPKKLTFIIPASHSLSIRQIFSAGNLPTGDDCVIDNGGGGTSLIYPMDIYTADEAQPNVVGINAPWKNLNITVSATQFIYILASY